MLRFNLFFMFIFIALFSSCLFIKIITIIIISRNILNQRKNNVLLSNNLSQNHFFIYIFGLVLMTSRNHKTDWRLFYYLLYFMVSTNIIFYINDSFFIYTHFFNTFLQPQLTHHVLVSQRKVVKYIYKYSLSCNKH